MNDFRCELPFPDVVYTYNTGRQLVFFFVIKQLLGDIGAGAADAIRPSYNKLLVTNTRSVTLQNTKHEWHTVSTHET